MLQTSVQFKKDAEDFIKSITNVAKKRYEAHIKSVIDNNQVIGDGLK